MPHYVVSYGGSFTKSLCRPSAFNQREYFRAAICKPYIFHRAKLSNTEIIITIFPKPLIYSALSVITFEGYVAFRTSHIFCNNCTPSMITICATIQFFKNPLTFPLIIQN